MEGLLKEGEEIMEEFEESAALDAALIAAGQKVEHYEIAGYGTTRSLAQRLGVFIEPQDCVEVWTGGFLLFPPDWEPIHWDPEVSPLGLELWGSDMPDTYLRYGTSLSVPATAPQPA